MYTHACADGLRINTRQRVAELSSSVLCYRHSRWAYEDKLVCSTTAAANKWAVYKKGLADWTGGKGEAAWTHSVPHYRVLTPAEGSKTLWDLWLVQVRNQISSLLPCLLLFQSILSFVNPSSTQLKYVANSGTALRAGGFKHHSYLYQTINCLCLSPAWGGNNHTKDWLTDACLFSAHRTSPMCYFAS